MMNACLEYSWPGNLRESATSLSATLILGDEKLAIAELNPKTTSMAGTRAPKMPPHGGADSSAGGLTLSRNAKDEAEAAPYAGVGADQLESQASGAMLKIQLQGAAVQDSPVAASPRPVETISRLLRRRLTWRRGFIGSSPSITVTEPPRLLGGESRMRPARPDAEQVGIPRSPPTSAETLALQPTSSKPSRTRSSPCKTMAPSCRSIRRLKQLFGYAKGEAHRAEDRGSGPAAFSRSASRPPRLVCRTSPGLAAWVLDSI